MKQTLHRAWQHLLFSGICSLLFGIIALIWPGISLLSLIWLFAAFMVVQGIAICSGAWRTRKQETNWWLLFLYGLLCIVSGVIAALYPGLTTIILGFIISLNLLAGGLIQVIMAIHLRKEIKGEGWLILSGLITFGIGVYLLMIPGGGAIAMLWLIAVAAVVLGILFILLAIKAKNWAKDVRERMSSV